MTKKGEQRPARYRRGRSVHDRSGTRRWARAKIYVIGEADTRINGEPVASERPWLAAALSDEKVSWFLGLSSALRVREWNTHTALAQRRQAA